MTAEFIYTATSISIGGSPIARLFQLRVGDTTFHVHDVDTFRWRHQPRQPIVVVLGYSENGVDQLCTHVPYEDETFAWAAPNSSKMKTKRSSCW